MVFVVGAAGNFVAVALQQPLRVVRVVVNNASVANAVKYFLQK